MRRTNDLVVTVKVSALIEILTANRAVHEAHFLKARAGFEAEAKEKLEQALVNLREKKLNALYLHLEAVENHTREYDRAIGMLEMHQSETIELQAADFQSLAQDDWDWKESWTTSNAKYMK